MEPLSTGPGGRSSGQDYGSLGVCSPLLLAAVGELIPQPPCPKQWDHGPEPPTLTLFLSKVTNPDVLLWQQDAD